LFDFSLDFDVVARQRLTACVSRKWAGVDNAWEQEKTEARKRHEKRGDSHLSAARCVGLKLPALAMFSLQCTDFINHL